MIEEIAIILTIIILSFSIYIMGYYHGKKSGITIIKPEKINLESNKSLL